MGVSGDFKEFVKESLKGGYDWESSSGSFSNIKGFIGVIEQSVARISKEEDREFLFKWVLLSSLQMHHLVGVVRFYFG